jgi:hypothetical protein
MRWIVPTPTPNIDAILRSPSLFFFLRAAWTARSACAAVVTAARVASPTVPLVFVTGEDPVRAGLVTSLDRPEDNLTGVTFFGGSQLGAKRLALLHELVPKVTVVAVLLDPDATFEIELVETAARGLGLQIVPVSLASERDLDAAFDRIVAAGAGTPLFGGGPCSQGPASTDSRAGGPPRAIEGPRIARLRRSPSRSRPSQGRKAK